MVTTFLYLLLLHFIADFLLQSDRIAVGKSTDNEILSEHVYIYFSTFLLGGLFIWGLAGAALYASVNAYLHWGTDYVTSRLSSYFYKNNDRHNFFVTIGADQLIHSVCLGLTLIWLV